MKSVELLDQMVPTYVYDGAIKPEVKKLSDMTASQVLAAKLAILQEVRRLEDLLRLTERLAAEMHETGVVWVHQLDPYVIDRYAEGVPF